MAASTVGQAILLAGSFSFLPLAAASAVGLCIGLFQAVTQIQEQTCLYLAKLAAVSLVIFFFGAAAAHKLIIFTQAVLLELH